MKVIILAGGGGTRFWPLSRGDQPKQFLSLVGDETLLHQTFRRLHEEYPPEDIFVATRKDYVDRIRKELPKIPDENYLIEPERRDTAPAMGYVAARLFEQYPDEPIAFISSDQVIEDHESFLRCLRVGDKVIRETGKMVDIGIQPTDANVNLGYSHIGSEVEEREGIHIYAFKGHTEKPDKDVAERYVKSKEYLWHANFYMWTPRKFLEAFKQYAPEMHAHLLAITKTDSVREQEKHFVQLEKISFDYAVTEKMDPEDVRILLGEFRWSDVGLWSVVKKYQEENTKDNVTTGEVLNIDTEDCLVYNTQDGKKVVAVVGLKGMIVVDTEDALLVCPQDRDQDIKRIVEELERKNLHRFV